MAECKLNKITIVCEKWKRKNLTSENAMEEIQKIVDLKESEMPPCTCSQPKETGACPMKSETAACSMKSEMAACPMKSEPSCPMPSKQKHACSMAESGSCPVCHAAGPMTINPFFNFMKEMRETTCFNKSVTEVSKEAGQRWGSMSDCEKAEYIVQAYKVSRNKNDAPKRSHSSKSMSEPKSKIKKKN